MKILVIGSGGREHAITWKVSQSTLCDKVYAAPGNPGMAELAECVLPSSSDPETYVQMVKDLDIDLTIVGPEVPLVAGVADAIRAAGSKAIGPSAKAAQLEGSKVFAKEFMNEFNIPTAQFAAAENAQAALGLLSKFGFPVVIKYDGLLAGKGVIIAQNQAEATAALEQLPNGPLVIEECLVGEEVSYIVYSDGKNVIPFDASQDHKPIFDGDKGPNTGGMGAYCDTRILTEAQRREINDKVIMATIGGMKSRGTPFSGFLYAGLMMTADGPKVLEFNVRLGDPECQPLMYRMEGDFVATLVDGAPMQWKAEPSVCVVMAAEGYPGTPKKGDVISGVEGCGATVFQAGTKATDKEIVTSGGRVLGVTSSGADLQTAIDNTYAAVKRISWDGVQYRNDIGAKGLKRW
jgi:phosphoribosylamine---glycine ligase